MAMFVSCLCEQVSQQSAIKVKNVLHPILDQHFAEYLWFQCYLLWLKYVLLWLSVPWAYFFHESVEVFTIVFLKFPCLCAFIWLAKIGSFFFVSESYIMVVIYLFPDGIWWNVIENREIKGVITVIYWQIEVCDRGSLHCNL